jgi:4-amino-4-deoxy-L-arabinose transferase-like glycosyltransferase
MQPRVLSQRGGAEKTETLIRRMDYLSRRLTNKVKAKAEFLVKSARKTEFLLFSFALAAYLPGIGWGLPNASGPDRVFVWATDDISPLAPLTEFYQTFIQTGPNPWLAYPLLHHFVLVVAYTPYFAWLMLTGQFESPSSIYPYGMQDPVTSMQTLTLIARVVSCCMAAGIVLVAYRIGLTLWGKREGVLASIVCLSSYQMLYYSKTANLEIPYLFWVSLGLLVYAKILINGVSVKRAILLATFAALAAATKDQAAGIFLLLPLVLIPMLVRDWKAKRTPLWSPILGFLIAGCVVYALASGLAVDPNRYFAHVDFILNTNRGHIGALYTQWYPATLSGMMELTSKFLGAQIWIVGPLIVLFACVTLIHSGRLEPWKLAFLLPAGSYLLTMILPMGYMYLRYVMPVSFILAIFSGRGMALALRMPGWPRLAASVGVVLALAWPLYLSLDLALQMRNDSRYEAEKWLSANVAENSRVGYLGEINALPRLRADAQFVGLPGGDGSAAVDYLRESAPEFVVIVPDWTSKPGMQHSSLCPVDLYELLNDGSLGYELASMFETKPRVKRQLLDYPSVNPPVRIFKKIGTRRVV